MSEAPKLLANFQTKEASDWAQTQYYTSLTVHSATNVQYINTTVTWALSLLTGGLAFVLTRKEFPDNTSIVALCVLLVVLAHFFVRACKAYINMLRFTTLQKLVIEAVINGKGDVAVSEAILNYHVNWACPLTRRAILGKVLAELGFGYFFVMVVALLIWSLHGIGWPTGMVFLALVTVGATVVDIARMLARSPYFSNPLPNEMAMRQR